MREAAELIGLRFAAVEERVAEAIAAMAFEQHALAAVEDFGKIVAGFAERLAEFVGVFDHRRGGRCADHIARRRRR